jgi:hypothetical protein
MFQDHAGTLFAAVKAEMTAIRTIIGRNPENGNLVRTFCDPWICHFHLTFPKLLESLHCSPPLWQADSLALYNNVLKEAKARPVVNVCSPGKMLMRKSFDSNFTRQAKQVTTSTLHIFVFLISVALNCFK